ncbi:MAG: hypothetical protein FWD31_12405, partial [Planctomycetaceae bacterium]|nr:hypothetical protein [Planctomycetaceae bacterium]
AVYFLFTNAAGATTGDRTPLNVTIVTNRSVPPAQQSVPPVQRSVPPAQQSITRTVTPVQQPARHNQLLREWWDKYNKDAGPFAQADAAPPVVKEYLRTMLAYRLGLQRPAAKSLIDATGAITRNKLLYTELGFQLDPTVSLFDAQAKRFFEPQPFSQSPQYDPPPALGDLIQAASGPESPLPTPKPEARSLKPDIEPLAFHVPSHCFYIRFGSYSNFAWLQDTTKLWGGDMRNLIALRALDTRSGERLEQQLGLRQDALAKLFGDAVIDDVAVIGTDLFFDEGASFGLLFRAKSGTLLTADFNAKRRELLRQHRSSGAVEQTLDVLGKKVSAITSPDHGIRTFYVAVDEYHLVTRSEQLARDFVALHVPSPDSHRAKPLSLGDLPEFQQARAIMPVEEKATIFLYFSRPYFYNITSPGYWIETQRRATAASDIELLRLAGMAAAAEGYGSRAGTGQWVHLLRAGGYVPPNFGPLPDGSDTVLASWKDIRNTLRGHRGSFVPIADMLPVQVTEAEYRAYQLMCRDFFENWGDLDPVVVSIKRTPGNTGIRANTPGTMSATMSGMASDGKTEQTEHIVIDARMSPMSRKNRETLQSLLGPPLEGALAPIPGNFASLEVSLKDNFFFGGLRNEVPVAAPGEPVRPLQQLASELIAGLVLKDRQGLVGDLLAGYLGYVGQPGPLLKAWDIAFLQRDDANGYSRGIGGTWRRHFGQYTLYSRQRSVLDRVAPQLEFGVAGRRDLDSAGMTDEPTHLRVTIGNPLTANIAHTLNHLGYLRTCDASRANLRLLNDLQLQFHINGQECKEVAEQLLGGELICPVAGRIGSNSRVTGRMDSEPAGAIGHYVYQPYGNPAFGMGRWHATALGTSQNQPPAGFLAPPLDWFRGGKLDAILLQDAVSVRVEFEMLLPKP